MLGKHGLTIGQQAVIADQSLQVYVEIDLEELLIWAAVVSFVNRHEVCLIFSWRDRLCLQTHHCL
jgi:uncharacterized protein YdeI (YjbR/CyaY-like superfamily)